MSFGGALARVVECGMFELICAEADSVIGRAARTDNPNLIQGHVIDYAFSL